MTINNILIVEDDPFQRRLLLKLLGALTQANLHIASNGRQALETLDSHQPPELILCDMNMPTMDGVEFLRCLSERANNSSIALISAAPGDLLGSVKEMAHAYGLSNIHLLPKPVSSQRLAKLLQDTVTASHSVMSDREQYRPNSDELLDALNRGEFTPFFQPHIDSRTGQIHGAEALVRWQHPDLGILGPGLFLSELSRLGLTLRLTESLISTAIQQCAQWHQQGYPLHIAVNVSPCDLVNTNFAKQLLDTLDQYQLPAEYLTLEVTETDACSNIAGMLDNLNRLRLHQVNVSIDDFGTGHSSMLQLISGPFSEIKIDLLFVRHMLSSDKHLAAVASTLFLAKQLNLQVVAEGVETSEQATKLIEMGCDLLQGFLFSPALPADQFINWCNEFQCRSEAKVLT